jgi:HAD superfamily hydrolase (TIGR01509 family)
VTHQVAALPAAVLFDMDGTLVDTERLWCAAVEQVASAIGRPLTEGDEPEVTGRPSAHIAAHLCRTFGPDAPDRKELAHRMDAAFTDLVSRGIVARPGALRLLDELAMANVPTAIVSASPRSVVGLVRQTLGHQRFVLVVGAEDTEQSKPAPDPYLAAAAALGVDPKACVAVEDTPVGVAAAEAAGCAVVVVPSAVLVPAASGRTICDSLEQVNLDLLSAVLTNCPR